MMDDLKMQKQTLKKAYKKTKRKHITPWKILAIICGVVTIVSIPLSILLQKFDNTMAARFGGSFWELENEDTNAQYYTSDFNSAEEMVDYGLALTQQVEAEGAALLMNNNNALPLAADAKVSTFSSSSVNLVYGGTGSGNIDASTADTLRTALEKVGVTVNPTLWDFYTVGAGKDYSRKTAGTVAKSSEVTAEVPWDVYTDEVKNSVAQYGDAAIVTLSRVGGEGADLAYGEVNYLALDENEKAMLQNVAEMKKNGIVKKTIVLINSANALQVDFLKNNEYDIDAALWIGDVGISGINAVAEILTGKVNPSGSLVDTYCYDNFSAPAMWNFTPTTYEGYVEGGDVPAKSKSYMIYQEGIYVGYKYYETRYEDFVTGSGNAGDYAYGDIVAYPFGYGMSYTDFDISDMNVSYNAADDTYTVTVKVTNTGAMAGKKTVQVYVQSPYTDYDKQNNVEKSSIQLLGYDKIDVAAGASETVTVDVPGYFLASYDANGAKGYILDAGDYYFAVGNGAHEALNNVLAAKCGDAVAGKLIDQDGNVVTGNTAAVATWTAPNTEVDTQKYRNSRYNSDVEVTNTFDDADVNYWANDDEKITYLSRSAWDTTYPTTLETLTVNDKLYNGLNMQTYVKAADAKSVSDFNLGVELDEKINFSDMIGVAFDDPKWNDFLSQLTLSDLLINMGDSKGIKAVKAVNKPGCTIVDGPEGMNGQFKYGDRRNCTGWATLPIVGATWNHDVQTRFGEMYGEDALYASIPIAYAPGADTLRSPYSGRTSEYFSEDGVLSYYAAKAVSHGMRNKGLIGTVKHFFLNEQEAGRQGISTFANEQSIREIYMRAFEGSLAEGDSLGVMTAYNRIGVMYAAANQGIQHILRDEWNYGGYIIDDALTASEYSSAPEMLMAGNNIFCLDTARPNEIEKLITSTDDGDLLQKVIDSNHYLYYIMLQSSMGGSGAEDVVVSDAAPWWQTTLRALDVVFCALAVAAVVMYVLHTYTDVFSEEKRKNRAAKKN